MAWRMAVAGEATLRASLQAKQWNTYQLSHPSVLTMEAAEPWD